MNFYTNRPIDISCTHIKRRQVKLFINIVYKHINHCTFVAKEVIGLSYYINSGSDVYACALDMQKAFDRVDLVKLFVNYYKDLSGL